MSRIRDVLLFFAAACLLAGTVAAQDKKVKKITGWGEVIDPDGDCKIVEEKGKVTITIPGTHHNLNPTADYDNLSAPRILQEVEGDFVLQVKVLPFARPEAGTSSSGRNSYTGAGLLVWHDGKNFIRFLRAANGEDNWLAASAELFQDGKYDGHHSRRIEDKATYLRLEGRAGKFLFSMSEDGQKWLDISTPQIELPKKLRVGVAATNSTTKEVRPQFEEFKLTTK